MTGSAGAWLVLVARLVVGAVWLRTGLAGLSGPLGYTLPAVELVIGLALVLGVMSRGAAVISIAISAGLLGASAIGLASADPLEVAPVLLLLAVSVWLVRVGPGRLALDAALGRRRTTTAPERDRRQTGQPEPRGVD